LEQTIATLSMTFLLSTFDILYSLQYIALTRSPALPPIRVFD